MFNVICFCALRLGYSLEQLKELHIVPHSLHGSMAAYAEAMDWDMVPVHRLGRWKIPISKASVVPVKTRRGAGRGGPKTISAVYSTASSCPTQLALRRRMIAAIRCIGLEFSTHGDLSCFLNIDSAFRGPHGHEDAG